MSYVALAPSNTTVYTIGRRWPLYVCTGAVRSPRASKFRRDTEPLGHSGVSRATSQSGYSAVSAFDIVFDLAFLPVFIAARALLWTAPPKKKKGPFRKPRARCFSDSAAGAA